MLQRLNFPGCVRVTLQIKLQERTEEEAGTPQPFGTLMVIGTFGNFRIRAVVAIDVVGTVIVVCGIECAHAGGTSEDLIREFQTL